MMSVATQRNMHPEIKVDATNDGPRGFNDQSRDGKSKQEIPSELPRTSSGLNFPAMLIRSLSGNNIPAASDIDLSRRDSAPLIDPLSQHIIERTRTDAGQSGKLKGSPVIDQSPERDSFPAALAPSRSVTELINARNETPSLQIKDVKKNRTSFLGRFRLGKKETAENVEEDDDIHDKRLDGTNAEMFSQPIGYIPRFAEPPKYIKVKAQGKKTKEFDRVFFAQELRGLSGLELAQAGGRRINPVSKSRGEAIWTLEFSKDGKYLASGGEEHIVRVWEVLSTEDDRRELEKEEETNKSPGQMRLIAPVFKRKPTNEYEGHTGTILDLSWSKNDFLLSSSMDKTVRLWHPTRAECLCAFKHTDHITSISFHPKDDRFFLAGSLDSKLRLWSIPDKSVAYWAKTNDLITAVAFTPDGKVCIAGCLTGSVHFYETDGLRSLTQMQIRSSGRKNARGAKITSIQTMYYPPQQLNGDIKLLITSNDSRIRIYNYRDKTLQIKFKGTENTHSQIRASFSDDARYVICGSEDKKAYIWPMGFSEKDKDKRPMEYFEAHNSTVTAAILAPTRSRQLLQASGDPIFEICNPPRVQLVSRSESQSSDIHSMISEDQETSLPTPSNNKPEETPAFQARSCHKNGNIIVTADFNGKIKVFRQDCAYEKRLKVNENWDAGSSKRILRRTSSVATRHSRHSAQDPMAFHSTERVQSWRQSLDRFSLPTNSPRASNEAFSKSPLSSTFARSRSPRKVLSNRKVNIIPQTTSNKSTPVTSKSGIFKFTTTDGSPYRSPLQKQPSDFERRPSETSIQGSLPGSSEEFILPDGAKASTRIAKKAFIAQAANTLTRDHKTHDLAEFSSSAEHSPRPSIELSHTRSQQDPTGHLMPSTQCRPDSGSGSGAASSILTDEMSGGAEGEELEEIKCRRCGGEEFKARKKSTGNILVCGRCGLELV